MKARENPFRSERVEALRYRSEGFSWDALEARLISMGGRGAIVGPHGHGKTTLLLEWAARCRRRGEGVIAFRLRERQRLLDADQRILLRDCTARKVFVDSAEQLSLPGWIELRWLCRRAGKLIVATHRPGRLRTLLRCRTSAALLEELTMELTGMRKDRALLWHKHAGNVRGALSELYAHAASGGVTRGIPAGSSR